MEETEEKNTTPFVPESLPLEGLMERAQLTGDGHQWLNENMDNEETSVEVDAARLLADDYGRTLRALQLLVAAGHVEAGKVYQAFEMEETLAD